MIRDKKISILLFVSFLLLLASFLILCTWVYSYYTKDKIIVQAAPPMLQPSTDTRDSLIRIYTKSIQGLETQLGHTFTRTDSMEASLSIKLDEYYKLKEEVSALLKNPAPSDDFRMAREKITELQQRISELRNTSQLIQLENARLHKLLAKYNQESKAGVQNTRFVEPPSGSVSPTGVVNKEEAPSKDMLATDISLSVAKEPGSEDDAFSSQRKIIGSFTLTNKSDVRNAEVMVIVIQPNGQVLQKSAWESGAFRTKEGKKIYSVKMQTGLGSNTKKLGFSIVSEKFLTGSYTLQLYSNGVLIGNISRQLS